MCRIYPVLGYTVPLVAYPVSETLGVSNPPDEPRLQWLTRPEMVTSAMRSQIAQCWQEVSNAGGAVGFPFPPVGIDQVIDATEEMVSSLDPLLRRVLVATVNEDLAGWLMLSRNDTHLTAHWAFVQRVQTSLSFR